LIAFHAQSIEKRKISVYKLVKISNHDKLTGKFENSVKTQSLPADFWMRIFRFVKKGTFMEEFFTIESFFVCKKGEKITLFLHKF
jgi:hypothetical protein